MFNLQPLSVELNGAGRVCGVKMVRTELGAPDAAGRRVAQPIAGSEHVLDADAVVMAFGFRPHAMSWLAEHDVVLDKQGASWHQKAAITPSRPVIRKSLPVAMRFVALT